MECNNAGHQRASLDQDHEFSMEEYGGCLVQGLCRAVSVIS